MGTSAVSPARDASPSVPWHGFDLPNWPEKPPVPPVPNAWHLSGTKWAGKANEVHECGSACSVASWTAAGYPNVMTSALNLCSILPLLEHWNSIINEGQKIYILFVSERHILLFSTDLRILQWIKVLWNSSRYKKLTYYTPFTQLDSSLRSQWKYPWHAWCHVPLNDTSHYTSLFRWPIRENFVQNGIHYFRMGLGNKARLS